MKTRRYPGYAAAIAAALATLLWFLPAVRHDFVNWDDNIYVTENTHLLRLDLAFFRWAFVESREVLWHPLTWISHALDVAAWGPNPAGHHFTSVLLHALNTLLVGLLTLRLLEAGVWKDRVGAPARIIAVLITSLLFGLHPIHVESVAWIAERKDVLSAFFYLGTLLAYLRYLEEREGSDRHGRIPFTSGRYLQCLGLFVLALLSKPMVVTLPLVMLLIDWYPKGRFADLAEARRALGEKIPFFLLATATLIILFGTSSIDSVVREATGAPWSKVLLACNAVTFYVVKLVWPANLSPLYLYPQEISLASPRFFVPLVTVIAISAACVGLARKRPVFAAVWIAFIATLLPVLGIVQIGPHLVADRYAYLASLGPFLLCGVGGSWCWGKASAGRYASGAWRIAAAGAGAAAFTLLLVLTARQISVWENSVTLWRAVLGRNQNALAGRGDQVNNSSREREGGYIAHTNLGSALAARGRVDEAVEHFRIAIDLSPLAGRARFNLAEILVARGRIDEAVHLYRSALENDPSFSQARNSLGVALMSAGDLVAAEAEFRRTLAANSDDAIAHFNLATIMARTARLKESAFEFREVLRLEPDNAEALARLGVLEKANHPAPFQKQAQ